MPRVDADLDAAFLQRVDRPLGKALGATEWRVALADDAKPHRRGSTSVAASNSSTAAATRASGSVSRQSERLLPPQPLLPQGRHGCRLDATMRCGTIHGPHSASPLGPNNATAGVPIAAAMCIGAVSTPMKSLAPPISAASSGSESFPARSTYEPFAACLI